MLVLGGSNDGLIAIGVGDKNRGALYRVGANNSITPMNYAAIVPYNIGPNRLAQDSTGFRMDDPQETYNPPEGGRDKTVLAAMDVAWKDSLPDAPNVRKGQPGSQKHEQGGWIVRDSRSLFNFWGPQTYSVVRWAPGSRDEIQSSPKPVGAVAAFQTHPNNREEGYYIGISSVDLNWMNARQNNVPLIIITTEGVRYYEPANPKDE